MFWLKVCLFAVMSLCFSAVSATEVYPGKTIRLIVGYPTGGNADFLARVIAERFQVNGWQTVVENRAGASGTIAAGYLAERADRDGHTMGIFTMGSMSLTPQLMKLSYGVDDLKPVIKLASYSAVLVVHPSLPVRNVRELVALAKSRPMELNCSSSGPLSLFHLVCEQLNSVAGIKIVHIAYKGVSPATTGLIIGEVQLMFNAYNGLKPFIDSGKVRAIAVTGRKRDPLLPDIPTMAETFPGFEVYSWMGLFVPKDTPNAIIGKLNAEITKILQEPSAREKWKNIGYEFSANSPEELSLSIKKEQALYGALIKKLGIKPQ